MAWEELIEGHLTEKSTWVSKNTEYIESMNRVEIYVHSGGILQGCLILNEVEQDFHVGVCASVFSQFVHPDYRECGVSLRMMREAISISREAGHKMFSYSHRVGDYRYEVVYRRL